MTGFIAAALFPTILSKAIHLGAMPTNAITSFVVYAIAVAVVRKRYVSRRRGEVTRKTFVRKQKPEPMSEAAQTAARIAGNARKTARPVVRRGGRLVRRFWEHL